MPGFFEKTTSFANKTNFYNTASSTSPELLAGRIISSVLGFLGIIFIGLMIYAGFTWMTASGDADDVKKAKKTLLNALIGLIVVALAYAISYFVLDLVLNWNLNQNIVGH